MQACCDAITDLSTQLACQSAHDGYITQGSVGEQACKTAYDAYHALSGAMGCSSTGSGGSSGGSPACDPIANTGCGPCQKCGFTGAAATPTCVTAGTVALGQACTRKGIGDDDCREGVCTEVGVPDYDPAATKPHLVCKKPCSATSDCTGGQRCAWGTLKAPPIKSGSSYEPEDGASFGVCATPCTVFTACAAGQSCHGAAAEWDGTRDPVIGVQRMFLTCRPDSMACGATSCSPTETCLDESPSHDTPACAQLCDVLHPCAAGTSCEAQSGLFTPLELPRCAAPSAYDLADCAGKTPVLTVTVSAAGFSPAMATALPWIPPGVVVKFTNTDTKPHTASSGTAVYSGYWTTGSIAPGASACILLKNYGSGPDQYFDALQTSSTASFLTCGGATAPCNSGPDCCSGTCNGSGYCN